MSHAQQLLGKLQSKQEAQQLDACVELCQVTSLSRFHLNLFSNFLFKFILIFASIYSHFRFNCRSIQLINKHFKASKLEFEPLIFVTFADACDGK